MPDYELHADFDRDGRLRATRAEHAQRATLPGAVLVPNLDADGRRLPASVTPGTRVTLDGRQPIAPANDDEQLSLRVMVRNASAVGSRFFLRPLGFPKIRLRFNDGNGRMLPRDLARNDDLPIALPARPGALDLRLSTRTLPGSPIGHVTGLETRFTLNDDDESRFNVQLLSVDAAGAETVHDEAQFTIAPFVILDHSARAVRVYIAEMGANEPSLTEMDAALRALGVPLVRVPADVAGGDSWLQDQFQHALIQGPDGWRQVILHLPRLRADMSAGTAAANLAQFVVSHFPSRNVGLFDDLWERSLQIFDTRRTQHRIAFRDGIRLATEMDCVPRLLVRFLEMLSAVDPSFSQDWPASWTDQMALLPVLLARVRRLPGSARNAEQRALLQQWVDDARDRYNTLAGRMPYDAGRRLAGLPAGGAMLEVDADTANRVYRRVNQMRSSANYGGNLEASPPTVDAPLGKMVIGNVVLSDGQGNEWDFMDPDVLRLLFKQSKQPVVQIDTSWLHVGHVDEVVAFAPDRGSSGSRFALLQASPALALALLRGARERYRAGLPPAVLSTEIDEPNGITDRLMTQGTSPVTRLMRGRVWRHVHPPATGGEIPNVAEPPLIYQRVSFAMNGGDMRDSATSINVHGIRFWPGEGPERRYPADITVKELLFAERDNAGSSTNEHIATVKMQSVADMIEVEFEQPRKLPLPVLFDRVPSVATWVSSPLAFATSAFTVDVVNMQVVNGRLLVPRPYGPRMRPDDAIAVIVAAMRALDVPEPVRRRVDARLFRRHGLTAGVYWIERQAPLNRSVGPPAPYSGATLQFPLYDGLETDVQVIAQFKDSFPGADDAELRRRIIDPNRRHFDARGRLRDGWRRFTIDDGMVDLFQAAILAATDELGVDITWIDTWFYHVRQGEIHCGTNVLREPARGAGLPDVWDVADQNYEPAPMEFEGVEINVPASE
jgi:hypothetical protein